MKLLDGSELVGYIKERQAKQVRALRQASKVFPRLAIVVTGDDPGSAVYVRLKEAYGADILIDVTVHRSSMKEIMTLINLLNDDPLVHGIVVQLPLEDPSATDEVVSKIDASKDVDGLGSDEHFVSATATAIDWLLAGYNVGLQGKKIAIIGQGRLVGAPLIKMWQRAGLDVSGYDDQTPDLTGVVRAADVIVTATGVPGLVNSSMIAHGAVVVDAGVASENGVLVGDVAADVRERGDVIITPVRGGVGPLTIAALFDNVIQAASKLR